MLSTSSASAGDIFNHQYNMKAWLEKQAAPREGWLSPVLARKLACLDASARGTADCQDEDSGDDDKDDDEDEDEESENRYDDYGCTGTDGGTLREQLLASVQREASAGVVPHGSVADRDAGTAAGAQSLRLLRGREGAPGAAARRLLDGRSAAGCVGRAVRSGGVLRGQCESAGGGPAGVCSYVVSGRAARQARGGVEHGTEHGTAGYNATWVGGGTGDTTKAVEKWCVRFVPRLLESLLSEV